MDNYAMGGQSQPNNQAGRDTMVRFYLKPIPDRAATEEKGYPCFKDAEYIELRAAGSRDGVTRRIRDRDKQMFRNAYDHWKQNHEQAAVDGMPLEEWPGVTRSQVETLKYWNCHTVEALADMPDDRCNNEIGWLKLKQDAINYLKAAEGAAPAKALQAELEKRDQQIASLQAAVEDQAAIIADLQKPKRRGRPPKAASE